MKYFDVLYTIREQQAMCWLLVSIRILTSTVKLCLLQLQLFIEDNLLHCRKFDNHPYCINHSDLRMDIGRTGILCMVIHSSIHVY